MRPGNNDRVYLFDNADSCVYLKNVIDDPDIQVGEHTYYNDFINDPRDFQKNNILYHFKPFCHDKIVIGKYCSIACGASFVCPFACHKTNVATSYPFGLINMHWDMPPEYAEVPNIVNMKGPTIVGNDVWLGYQCLIMPGVTIGDGACIGSRAIVTKDVEPYTVVAGVPAKPIRKRFDDKTIEQLLELKWWDLPDEVVANLLPMLVEETDMSKVIDHIRIARAGYEIAQRIKAIGE